MVCVEGVWPKISSAQMASLLGGLLEVDHCIQLMTMGSKQVQSEVASVRNVSRYR